jgi:iron complex outermembrane receptor protein
LEWVSGVYFLKEDAHVDLRINSGFVRNDISVVTTGLALYSDVTYSVLNDVRVIAGGRLSREDKTFDGLQVHPLFGSRTVNQDETWTNFSPRFGLQYDLNDNAMLYGIVSKGFKSGGFNFVSDRDAYDPETVSSLELGSKLSSEDNRLQLNSAMFYYDYKDLQLNKFVAPGVLAVENATDADVYGVEFEGRALLVDNWTLAASLTYLDATYGSYVTGRTGLSPLSPATEVDVSGNYLNSAPKYTINLMSDTTVDLAHGDLEFHVEYRWQDKVYFTAFNDETEAQAAYGILNASLAYVCPEDIWQIKGYVHNIADKAYTNASQGFAPTGIAFAITEPRTFGLEMRYKFK